MTWHRPCHTVKEIYYYPSMIKLFMINLWRVYINIYHINIIANSMLFGMKHFAYKGKLHYILSLKNFR